MGGGGKWLVVYQKSTVFVYWAGEGGLNIIFNFSVKSQNLFQNSLLAGCLCALHIYYVHLYKFNIKFNSNFDFRILFYLELSYNKFLEFWGNFISFYKFEFVKTPSVTHDDLVLSLKAYKKLILLEIWMSCWVFCMP